MTTNAARDRLEGITALPPPKSGESFLERCGFVPTDVGTTTASDRYFLSVTIVTVLPWKLGTRSALRLES
jgi:hypothetical protein